MKALKFLGIALLACGMMFTSCKKDDTTANNNNNSGQSENPGGGGGTNPGGGGGQTTPDGTTITFNGSTWTAANLGAVDHTSDNYLTFIIEKTSGCSSQATDTYLQGFMESVVIADATYESTEGDCMSYYDPSYIYTDNDGVLGDAGGQYWGWNAYKQSFVENVTAVDLNALTMSANFTEDVFDIVDYINAGGLPDNMYQLKGTMTNAHWTWVSSKAADSKKMSAQLIERVK